MRKGQREYCPFLISYSLFLISYFLFFSKEHPYWYTAIIKILPQLIFEVIFIWRFNIVREIAEKRKGWNGSW